MRILFLGDYSNLHWTIAQALTSMGQLVTVASDGGEWRNFSRHYDLSRRKHTLADNLSFLYRIIRLALTFHRYDVIHLINPRFLPVKQRVALWVAKYLFWSNKNVFMGANGSDFYIVLESIRCEVLRYSEYNVDGKRINQQATAGIINGWISPDGKRLTDYVATHAKGISACLYEYAAIYGRHYPDKTVYIPLPINMEELPPYRMRARGERLVFFVGIQNGRKEIKGLDIMGQALERLKEKYPERVEVVRVEDVPYHEYVTLLSSADVLLDQLYSYTPSMNSLLAMAQGIVVVGGGEEEAYDIIDEKELRPIVNVLPNEEDVFTKMEALLLQGEASKLSAQSIEFVKRHHHYQKVAQHYLDLWSRKSADSSCLR